MGGIYGKTKLFFSGITDILILAILCEQDSYVYEIVKFIKENQTDACPYLRTPFTQSPTSLLTKENQRIFKACRQKRTRIYYHIEDEGRAYYENLLESFHNAYSGVESILNILKEDKGNEQ